ncbi:hypothetical protein RRG08_056402 [Elysia crispata]|uniref:Uncharacterized protein n=1 Tax=Elysia crispata TaxID=231223 RepID=A0AAE1D7F6_9GAST|nr:hypothetical protein RRG08_056402 [Elysia crispata]
MDSKSLSYTHYGTHDVTYGNVFQQRENTAARTLLDGCGNACWDIMTLSIYILSMKFEERFSPNSTDLVGSSVPSPAFDCAPVWVKTLALPRP